jgi:HK97 family phage portal protein
MSLVRNLIEGRTIKSHDFWGRWASGEGDDGGNTYAGKAVNQAQALRLSAVHACVTLISDEISTLPVAAVQADGKIRTPVKNQPAWIEEPNPEDDRQSFNEAIVTSLLMDGNGYAEVIVDRLGKIVEVWPLNPQRVVRVYRRTSGPGPRREKLIDFLTDDGAVVTAQAYRFGGPSGVLHFRAHRLAGSLKGASPIERAKQAIGLGLVTEEYGARFFGQGTHAGGVIELDGPATQDVVDRLKDGWEEHHSKPGKAHRPGVLSDGAKWKQMTVPPEHAQFLETRKFQVAEIARFYRVAPHLVGDVERSTSWGTGIEEQAVGFVVHTLRPWIVRNELGQSRMLARPQSTVFNVEGLLRGDTKSRYEAYRTGRQWGWLSVNDIRALENQPPVKGGDSYMQPLNMTTLDNPQGDRSGARLANALRELLELEAPT